MSVELLCGIGVVDIRMSNEQCFECWLYSPFYDGDDFNWVILDVDLVVLTL